MKHFEDKVKRREERSWWFRRGEEIEDGKTSGTGEGGGSGENNQQGGISGAIWEAGGAETMELGGQRTRLFLRPDPQTAAVWWKHKLVPSTKSQLPSHDSSSQSRSDTSSISPQNKL